jgi:hypothetical protein
VLRSGECGVCTACRMVCLRRRHRTRVCRPGRLGGSCLGRGARSGPWTMCGTPPIGDPMRGLAVGELFELVLGMDTVFGEVIALSTSVSSSSQSSELGVVIDLVDATA